MSDEIAFALIASVAPTLTAIGAIVVTIMTGRRTDVVQERTMNVHKLVNSELSKKTLELEIANAKITALEKVMSTRAKVVAKREGVEEGKAGRVTHG